MTASHVSYRSTAVVAVQQVALAALVFVLVVIWLQIPDANALEVVASVALAALIALVAGAGESAIALRLTGRPVTARALLVGTGVVLVAALLWLAASAGVDRISATDTLRAGYWNSRFPSSLRTVFTYQHLLLWMGWGWSVVRCVAAGLLAAAAFAFVTCHAPGRGLVSVLRSGRYWLSLLLLAVVSSAVTGALFAWTPGHGLRLETLSLGLRLLLAILLNATAVALLLQAMAAAVLRIQSAGTAAPEINHPRTVEMP